MPNAQQFLCLLFNVDDLFLANPSSPLLVYVPTDIPTMKQPVKFYVVLLANHEDTLVYSVVDQYAHWSIHLFINLPAHLYAFFPVSHEDLPVYPPSGLFTLRSTRSPTFLFTFSLFFLRITMKTSRLLIYIPIHLYRFINLHFHPANREGVPVHSPASLLVHRPTRSSSYLFIFMFPSG